MVDKNQVVQAGNLLKQSKSLLIFLPQNPPLDSLAAGLGLYLSLKAAKKNVQIGCPTPISVGFNRLFGVDKISDKVGSRNLVISFPHIKESIEEISTYIENQTFNVVISPQKGGQPLNPDKVAFSRQGIDAEVMVVIGARKLEDLGSFYTDGREAFSKAQIISVANYPNSAPFGTINLVDAQIFSCSEMTARLLRKERFSVKSDIATNLVAGVESATNNLQFKTTAETFEIIAWLMRQGGKRGHMLRAQPVMGTAIPEIVPQMGMRAPFPAAVPQFPQPAMPGGQLGKAIPRPPFQTQSSTPAQPEPASPNRTAPPSNQPPIFQEIEATDVAPEGSGTTEGGQVKPSPDWYKPKIFKGKTTI